MSDPLFSTDAADHAGDREVIGLDIGGTKCAVSHLLNGRVVEVLRIPTGNFEPTFRTMLDAARSVGTGRAVEIGISCGGPLDSGSGTILTPPNLHESWHHVAICQESTQALGGQASLMNDANACALAEWRFGAGRGSRNMIFLTAGTGMGAGLILNGELYEGTTGDAGEIGHVRLAPEGPLGYGKHGSVEGFCSGGGIARLAELRLRQKGAQRSSRYPEGQPFSTKTIAEAARAGDEFAREIMGEAATHLGDALAMLIDLFNPERIVLGGFFPRCRDLLEPAMQLRLAKEALPAARAACQILPAELGDTIGSHGAIAIAMRQLQNRKQSSRSQP